jgi:hypothetical protein
MAFTENYDEFLGTDDFGVDALYKGTTTVQGIFDKQYFEAQAAFAGVHSSQPTFLGKASDFEDAAHGDTLLINSVNYKVVGVEPDGTGFTLLRLETQ